MTINQPALSNEENTVIASPSDPAVGPCLGPYGGPRGGAVSYERGTSVGLRVIKKKKKKT